jgi:thiol-disulfide isomerase/thioredoxin
MYKNKLTKDLGLLFIHASGCPHCTSAKPIYTKLVSDFPSVTFEDTEINDEVFQMCQQWLPSEYEMVEKTFQDGTKARTFKLVDGKPVKYTPMAFPAFLFFNKEGFIGHVTGADEKQLSQMIETLLGAMNEQAS